MMPSIEAHGSTLIQSLAKGFVSLSSAHTAEAYQRHTADRTRLWRAWSTFMVDCPLVLAPVSQRPPFPQGEDERGPEAYHRLIEDQSMLYAINLLGLPSAAVPTGLHDGAPIGVQIIGPRLREDLCLDAAESNEDAVGVLTQRLWQRS